MPRSSSSGEAITLDSVLRSLMFFGVVLVELAVLFVVVSTLVSLGRQYVPEHRMRKALTKRWGLGNVLGAALGSLTPFCSFSTIPVLVGLLRSGVPFGASVSFLFASPLANPVVLGLFLVLFGWWVTVVYASLALASAMLVGVVWERSGLQRYLKPVVAPAGECVSSGAVGEEVAADGFRLRLRLAFSSGWEQFRSALPYLFAGVAAGAVIYGFVPSEWVVTVAGPDNPFAIPVAAAIGAPLYVWPETMLPMGAALLEKGMGIGALIALVVGGAGASIPEVTVLGTVFKARLLLVYVATILAVAVLIGYAFAMVF